MRFLGASFGDILLETICGFDSARARGVLVFKATHV
jgi:hypothetical protein